MRRPSFQFYPADWRNNAKLRRCSFSERGIWLEVVCLFHDSDEYGMLRWPLRDIAQAIGCKLSDLRSIATKGVIKGGDDKVERFSFTPRHAGKDGEPVILIPDQVGPIWFSSRMVRDEYVRHKRGEGTRFGDEPKAIPKPPIGEEPIQREGDGPSSSSSSSTSKKKKTKPADAARPVVIPDGVDLEVWRDFLALRKAKKAPLTETALDGISREAVKAGLSLEDALRTCCKRGWQGFEAAWLGGSAAAPDYSSLLKGD